MKSRMHTLNKPFGTIGGVLMASMLALGLPSGNVIAASDGKIFSGSNCKPWYGSDIGDFIFTNTAIYNHSTTSHRWVTCPLTRDRVSSAQGIQVRVNARRGSSFNGVLSCYLRSNDPYGYAFDSDSASYSGSSSVSLSMLVDSSPGGGDYTLSCYLPGGDSKIFNYELYEPQ